MAHVGYCIHGVKPKGKRRAFVILFSLFAASFLLSLSMGQFVVPIAECVKILLSGWVPVEVSWTEMMANTLLNIRLPRTWAAMLVGGGLALSGATYQSVFRNPLVSPDLLGVSAGACVGAACAILLKIGALGTQLLALFFGWMAVSVAVFIPRVLKNSSILMMVLSGAIVNGVMHAVLGFLKYVADPEAELASIVYWTMGSLAYFKHDLLLWMTPMMVAAAGILMILRWRLNLLGLNDGEAASLGMHVRRMRMICILCSTLLTACAICISGTIGWIGLMIPHLCRLAVGRDNRYLMPASVLMGASFLILTDVAARNLTGSEIPLSIITGLMGGPLFLRLLVWQKERIE